MCDFLTMKGWWSVIGGANVLIGLWLMVEAIRYRRKSARLDRERLDEQIGQRVMVRTRSYSVFTGTLEYRGGMEVLLSNARLVLHWEGAETLSHLAVYGTPMPEACRFSAPISEMLLLDVILIIPITHEAAKSIDEIPVDKDGCDRDCG